MQQISWRAAGCALIAVGSIVGLILSIYNYLTPLTGINGSIGAALVCASTFALLLDGVFLTFVARQGYRSLWLILGFLGAIGTLAAGYFLHAPVLIALMVVVLIGLVVAMAGPSTRSSISQG